MTIRPEDVPGELVMVFGLAWHKADGAENVQNCSEHDMGDCPHHSTPGARTRAGLAAVLNHMTEEPPVITREEVVLSAESIGDAMQTLGRAARCPECGHWSDRNPDAEPPPSTFLI